ncbi:hypothetical protein Tco_0522002, partial [Tanacetum coccineum]
MDGEDLSLATYPNLFTIKIHHNGEFSKPPKRRYKIVVLNYVDLVDCDVLSVDELNEMLEEPRLRDNNKTLFTHFKIPGMSLDDVLVSLMADADVIKLLNYLPMCKETKVCIETDVSLVEQHLVEFLVSHSQSKEVVSSSEKELRLLMLEWLKMGKKEEYGHTLTHALTYDVYPIVEFRNIGKTRDVYPILE